MIIGLQFRDMQMALSIVYTYARTLRRTLNIKCTVFSISVSKWKIYAVWEY